MAKKGEFSVPSDLNEVIALYSTIRESGFLTDIFLGKEQELEALEHRYGLTGQGIQMFDSLGVDKVLSMQAIRERVKRAKRILAAVRD